MAETEETKEENARLHPFDMRQMYDYVRESTAIYDRRYSQLTDLFHQSQTSFVELKLFVEGETKYLRGRIDEGISKKLNTVFDQNVELKNQMTELKGHFDKELSAIEQGINKALAENDKRVSLMDQHYSEKIGGYDTMKKDVKDFLWKMAAAGLVSAVGAMTGMYLYMNSVRSQIDQIPAVIAYQQAMEYAKPKNK